VALGEPRSTRDADVRRRRAVLGSGRDLTLVRVPEAPSPGWLSGEGGVCSTPEELIYYIRSLGPHHPMWFRNPSLRNRNGMLLFLVDQRGLFVRYSVTSQPSP